MTNDGAQFVQQAMTSRSNSGTMMRGSAERLGRGTAVTSIRSCQPDQKNIVSVGAGEQSSSGKCHLVMLKARRVRSNH